MRHLHLAVFGAAMGIGAAWAMPAQAMDTAISVDSPFLPFTVVETVAIKNPAPFITLLSPNGGEMLRPGERVEVRWDTSGMGAQTANIWFSADGGVTYELVAGQVAGTGTYRWNVPNVITREGVLAVEITDMVDVLAVDYSDAFFDITSLPATAVSPVTGEYEDVYAVVPGDFIWSPTYEENGYYVSTDMERYPVTVDEAAYTYILTDEDPVMGAVSDATLALLPLGHALVPKPGAVLVKFADSAATYAVEGTPEMPLLRLLNNEVIAELNYGAEWKEYVMQLPVSLRNSYYRGSDIVSDIDPDLTSMVKPEDLETWLEEMEELAREAGIEI